MEREYLVYGGTFSVPSTGYTSLGGVNFLNRLKTTNNMAQRVMDGFRFMRWKSIEWRVVFGVSPFVYGCVVVTGLPVTDYRGTLVNDYGLYSHDDCVLVDVTTMPEVKISQPWMFPFEWYDNVFVPTVSNVQPYVSLLVATPNALFQQNSDAPTSLGVQVFARFEGLELSAWHDPNEVPFESQSASPTTLAAGVLATGATIGMNHFYKRAGEIGTKAVEDTVDKALGVVLGDKTTEAKSSERVAQGAETTTNNATDVIPNVYGGMVFSPQKNLLGDGHQCLPYSAPEHSIMDFLKKPSLISMGTLTTSFTTAGASGYYCDPFANSDQITDNYFSCSRIRFMGQFYRRWRGSINYTFVFFSSPFNTWRLGFRLNFANQPGFAIGDQAYKTITVRGSNIVNMTMPWNFPYTWDYTSSSFANINRYTSPTAFEKLAVSGPDDAVLFYMVYEAAGDDFQFCSQREPSRNWQTGEEPFESQMKVNSFCKHDSIGGAEPNIPRVANTGLTFETLAKRWSGRSGAPTNVPTWGQDPQSQGIGTFDALSSIFLYYRGMQRQKLVIEDTLLTDKAAMFLATLDNEKTFGDTTGLQYQWRPCDGMAVINLGLTQVLEYTIPYVAAIDWQTSMFEDPAILGNWEACDVVLATFIPGDTEPTSPLIGNLYVAGGSDFVYSYILPPPWYGKRWYDIDLTPFNAQKSRVDLKENLKEREEHKLCKRVVPRASKRDRIHFLREKQKDVSPDINQSTKRFDESTSFSERSEG